MCQYCEKEKIVERAIVGRKKNGQLKWGDVDRFITTPFCSNPEMTIHEGLLSVDYNAYSTDSSFYEDFIINYCPFCGRKLNNDGISLKT